MATQDLQSLRAELHDAEGELHHVAAKIERELAAGAELDAARDQRAQPSRRAG